MGTEVAVSFTTLRAQLESEKSTLYKIDESIKKIVQSPRYSDRFNKAPGEFARGGFRGGQRNSFPDNGTQQRSDELFGKRKQETKTVFSRLTNRGNNSDGEDEPNNKRSRVHSAVSRELPSRAAVLQAQGGDEQARKRNKRIFGALLGTLQKFKQEEIGLQDKEEKKAQVERKIEEQAKQQKEKEQLERKTLFAERESKKASIRSLEAKMSRVQEFERWEQSQRHRGHFILTKATPPIYWLPKRMNDSASDKLKSSRSYHEQYMVDKREELKDELVRIEQRCMRRPGTAGHVAAHGDPHNHAEGDDAEGNNRRDKFARGGEGAGDSEGEGEDAHRADKPQENVDTDSAPQDSNVTAETNNISDEANFNSHEANNTSPVFKITPHETIITLHEPKDTTPEPDPRRNEHDIAENNHISDSNHDEELSKENINDEQ